MSRIKKTERFTSGGSKWDVTEARKGASVGAAPLGGISAIAALCGLWGTAAVKRSLEITDRE